MTSCGNVARDLIYASATGWGRTGPLARQARAGHHGAGPQRTDEHQRPAWWRAEQGRGADLRPGERPVPGAGDRGRAARPRTGTASARRSRCRCMSPASRSRCGRPGSSSRPARWRTPQGVSPSEHGAVPGDRHQGRPQSPSGRSRRRRGQAFARCSGWMTWPPTSGSKPPRRATSIGAPLISLIERETTKWAKQELTDALVTPEFRVPR